MAIMDWRSQDPLNPFFRLEGRVRFNDHELALEFKVHQTGEEMVVTLTTDEIKELAHQLDRFTKTLEEIPD